MKKAELVVPAGSFETLTAALEFGADSVYLGPRAWSLRTGTDDFDAKGIVHAVAQIKRQGKKAYVTLNAVLNNRDLQAVEKYVKILKGIQIDAVILSDPALIPMLKAAGVPFHISTQMNVLNKESALFWKRAGARRIVLARELGLSEIREICSSVNLAFEVFVHGALCISYSGRCLLSDYLALRSGNKGACAHVCRWGFALNEEREKGRYYPVEEADGKTYILNSRDLCTIKMLPEIIETGVQALKIEGRNKGIHYISVVTRVYREAIDTYYRQGRCCRFKTQWERDLKSVSNRGYTTGFLKELEYQKARQHYAEEGYRRDTTLAGIIKEVLPGKRAVVDIKNDFSVDMRVSLFSPEKGSYLEDIRVVSMESVDGKREFLVHTNRVVIMEFPHKVSAGSLIRVKNDGTER